MNEGPDSKPGAPPAQGGRAAKLAAVWFVFLVCAALAGLAAWQPIGELGWVRDTQADYSWAFAFLFLALVPTILCYWLLTGKKWSALPNVALLAFGGVVATHVPAYWDQLKELAAQRKEERDHVFKTLESNSAFRAAIMQFATLCGPDRQGSDTKPADDAHKGASADDAHKGAAQSEPISDACRQKYETIMSKWMESSWLLIPLIDRIAASSRCAEPIGDVRLACRFLKTEGTQATSLAYRIFVHEFVRYRRRQEHSGEPVGKALQHLSETNRLLACAILVAGYPSRDPEQQTFSPVCRSLLKDAPNEQNPHQWTGWWKK